jgi:hypothetical protein
MEDRMSPRSTLDADAMSGTRLPGGTGDDARSGLVCGAGGPVAAPDAEDGPGAGPRERRRRWESDVERAQPADPAPGEAVPAESAPDEGMRDERADVDDRVDEGFDEVDEGAGGADDPDAR